MKYWLFADHKPQGPFELGDLKTVPEFGPNSQVCKVGDDVWQRAENIPEIAPLVAPHKVIHSGDFVTEEKSPIKDWRQNVVPTSNLFTQNTYKPPVEGIKITSNATPTIAAPASKKPWKGLRKNKWTLAALWTFFFGLYIPQMDQIDKIVETSIETSMDVPLQGFIRHVKSKGRIGWKKNHVAPAAAATALPSTKTKIPTPKKNPNETILNEEIAEMANGVIIKTVISEVKSKKGKKQIKTRRYIRMSPTRPFEPL